MHTDLFPETLLVSRDGGRIYTTSRTVAIHFNKRHKHVLRTIEQVIKDLEDSAFTGPNFGLSEYTDPTGRALPEYHLTEEGFALIAMRFTGKTALLWQKNFLQAFITMRLELQARTARYAHALDVVRPALRPVVEGTELGRSRADIGGALGKSPGAVTYHRRNARRLGLLQPRRSIDALPGSTAAGVTP